MSTATAVPTVATVEVRKFEPSAALMALSTKIREVAGFDPGLVPVFRRATQVAAVKQLMSHPDMSAILDALEGSKAGFLTDLAQKNQKYDPKVRDSALTSALSQGAQLAGGEITILAGNGFLNKPFYQRMLDELGKPGSYTESCKYEMLWWDPENGEIVLNGPMAKIPIKISYKLRDKETGEELAKVFERTFQIRTYPSDGPDKWIGQAERRAFQKLLRYLSRIDFGEDEGDSGTPSAPPPVGTVSLSRETAAAPAKAAEDAQFSEIVKGQAPAPEKPYAEMTKQEKVAYHEKHKPLEQPAPAKADVKIGNATIPNMPAPKMPPGTPPAGPSIATPPPTTQAPATPPAGAPDLF